MAGDAHKMKRRSSSGARARRARLRRVRRQCSAHALALQAGVTRTAARRCAHSSAWLAAEAWTGARPSRRCLGGHDRGDRRVWHALALALAISRAAASRRSRSGTLGAATARRAGRMRPSASRSRRCSARGRHYCAQTSRLMPRSRSYATGLCSRARAFRQLGQARDLSSTAPSPPNANVVCHERYCGRGTGAVTAAPVVVARGPNRRNYRLRCGTKQSRHGLMRPRSRRRRRRRRVEIVARRRPPPPSGPSLSRTGFAAFMPATPRR